MEKKTYIVPSVDIIDVTIESIMEASSNPNAKTISGYSEGDVSGDSWISGYIVQGGDEDDPE